MKIISIIALILLFFTNIAFSQNVNKDNFIQFCENIEVKGLATKNLIDEYLEIEEPTQMTWFVRSFIIDFHTELTQLKSYCEILDLIDKSKFDVFFERVSNDYNIKTDNNRIILEEIASSEGRLGDEKLNKLIKQLISYRKEFYK